MPDTSAQLDDGQLTQIAEAAYEAQRPDTVKGFKKRLRNSIETGLRQIEEGDCMPFDEDCKSKIRSM